MWQWLNMQENLKELCNFQKGVVFFLLDVYVSVCVVSVCECMVCICVSVCGEYVYV